MEFISVFLKENLNLIRIVGSGAKPGKMLDIGLFKISKGVVFFLFLSPAGGGGETILIPFLTMLCKANLYLTKPELK